MLVIMHVPHCFSRISEPPGPVWPPVGVVKRIGAHGGAERGHRVPPPGRRGPGRLGRVLRQFFSCADRISQVLAVGIGVNLAAYLMSATPTTYWSARELAGVLPAGAVLAGRMLGARFLSARLV